MKICNYWSESNSLIYFYIVLNKSWKNTGLNLKFYWSCAGEPVLIVRSWAGGPVLIVRSWAGGSVLIVRSWAEGSVLIVRSYAGGPVLIVRSWAGGPVLIVRSWAGGPVLIVRTAVYSLWFYFFQIRFKLFGFPMFRFWAYWSDEGYSRNVGTKLDIYVCITGFQNKSVR